MTDPTSTEVGRWYDTFGTVYSLTMGASLHLGMWEPGDPDLPTDLGSGDAWRELTLAQDRWTDRLVERLAPTPGQTLLDVGCGTGRPTRRLARSTPDVMVVGVTNSRDQLRSTSLDTTREPVRFEYGSAMELPFETETFDGAWAIESFAHFDDRDAAVRELFRVLRPGSRFVLADCFEAHPFNDEEIDLFRTGFAISKLPDNLDYYPDLLTGHGFTIDHVDDRTGYFGPTYDLIPLAYADARAELVTTLGEDVVAGIDDVYPQVQQLCRNKMGYVAVTARKP